VPTVNAQDVKQAHGYFRNDRNFALVLCQITVAKWLFVAL